MSQASNTPEIRLDPDWRQRRMTSNTPSVPIYYVGLRVVTKDEYLAALMRWSTHFGTVQP